MSYFPFFWSYLFPDNIYCARESGGRPAFSGLKIRPLLDERIPSSGSINTWSPDKQLIFSHVLLEEQNPNQTKPRKASVLTY